MHRVHIPEPGTTLRDRLEVWVASLAFGCCRFMGFSFEIKMKCYSEMLIRQFVAIK